MMNELQRMFIERTDGEQADALLLVAAQNAMEDKLDQKRIDGRGGWHGPTCSNEALIAMLEDHLIKGDMVDVMNIAAMIYVRSILYGDEA